MKINIFILFIIFIITCIVRKIFQQIKEKAESEPTQTEMSDTINNYFKDSTLHKCLDYQPTDKSICKINKNRRCIKENHAFCYIDIDDTINATEYAYRKLCKDKGNCPVLNKDGTYKCEFTKKTCLASSKNTKDVNQEFLDDLLLDKNDNPLTGDELKEAKKTQKYNKHYWIEGIGCIDGTMSGLSSLHNYCQVDHPCSMGLWKFDEQKMTCSITKEYCNEMKMKFDGNMCIPKDTIAEKLVGKFVSRGLPCPRYADKWGGGIRNESDHAEKVIAECNKHLIEP